MPPLQSGGRRTRYCSTSTVLLFAALCAAWAAPTAAAEPQPSFACSAADDAAACAALGSLYAATGGSAWSPDARSGGWAHAAAGVLRPPLCSLAGVGCDAAGALTSLSLSSCGLRGTLPDSLSSLHGLRLLDLSHNALDGTLPSALQNLSSSLEALALNNNRLTGQLPAWLGALTALRALDLGVNALRGPLPALLPQMRALRTLSLHDNPLRATIPESIGDLMALEMLEMHYTALQGSIPGAALGRLTALTMLALQNNDLMGDIPEELSRLPQLRVLFLFDNMLLLGRAPPAWVASSAIAVLRVGDQRPLPPPPPHALAAYCEALRGGRVAQPVDSYSNVPFVLLGAYQAAVGTRDAWRTVRHHQHQPWLAMERFALFSLLNGAAQMYLGVCSFLFHADVIAEAQQMDMGAVLLALAVPALYAFWRLGTLGPPHARIAHAAFCGAVGGAALCLYRFKEQLRVYAGGSLQLVLPLLALMAGALMAWAWLLGSPAEASPLSCDDTAPASVAQRLRRAWMRRALPRGLRYRYAVAAAVAAAAAFAARQMDVTLGLYCWPRSAFQLHAAWHVLAAVALAALWRFLRSEEAPGGDAVAEATSATVLAPAAAASTPTASRACCMHLPATEEHAAV